MHNVSQLKTKIQRWAEKITNAYGDSVQAVIEVGRQLQQAKAECSHGEWGELTGETTGKPMLPFSFRTARMLKAIAENAALSDRQHVADLPASWGTLAVLASLDPDDIEAAIADGTIRPEMERKDAEALKAQLNPPKPPAAPPVSTEVLPLTPPPMSEVERAAWNDALKEGGQMIADVVERQAEREQVKAELAQELRKNAAMREELDEAERTGRARDARDPDVQALSVWVPIESALENTLKAVARAEARATIPTCPGYKAQKIITQWATISEFLSQHAKQS